MKHFKSAAWIAVLFAIMLSFPLFADPTREIFLNEDFSMATFPPTGWTIDAHAANWSRFNGANAGGSTPEARFSWSPQFTGATYLISPVINTTGQTTILLDFCQLVDHYTTPYSVGVATRSNNGAWQNAWTASPNANIGPEVKTVTISNTDVGSDSFQFAFFFSGNAYNIDYWYIDNVKLYTPFPFDLAIGETPGPGQLTPGTAFMPTCEIENAGLGYLTATVSLNIYLGDLLVQSYPDQFSYAMDPGATQVVTFPEFSLIAPDDIYTFVYSISSIEDVVDGDLSNNTATKYIETYTTPKQNVLLEIGTGGWCQYCPGAAMGADDLHEGEYSVGIVENHNGDPYATDISNGRNSYYGITGYPTAVFDGLLRVVGGSNTESMFDDYLPLYQERMLVKTPITLGIYGTLDRDSYSLSVFINKMARIVRPNLVLHLAATESDIQYSWQGQTEMNFVNRTMLPNGDGTSVNLVNLSDPSLVVPLTLTIGNGWLTENMDLVAWVQDLDTKEVLQCETVWLPMLEAPPVANNDDVQTPQTTALLGNYPNPFNPQTSISFRVNEAVPVNIGIYNARGQLVRSLSLETRSAGTHSVTWDGRDESGLSVSNGIYYYKMTAGRYSSTRKMLLMK